MTAQVKGLAEFLKKYAIGMFDHGSDQSFILLQHHFIMLGRAKGPMTKHECMPLCLHSFESFVAPRVSGQSGSLDGQHPSQTGEILNRV